MYRKSALEALELPFPPAPRTPRRRVILAGEICSTTARHRIVLRNLSSTGAMAEGADLPEAGRDIVLQAGSLDLFCRVVWSDGERCGLEFDEPIPHATVVALSRVLPDPAAERMALHAAAGAWARPEGRCAWLD